MKLTELQVKNATLEPGKTKTSLTDGDGLRLEITKTSKSFVYRKMIHGKREYIHIGTYPNITLKQARQKKDELKVLIQKYGFLEAKNKFKGNSIKQKEYFEDIANEWIENYTADEKTLKNTIGRLNNYIFPYFKGYKIKEIKHIHLSNFFKQFKDKQPTADKIKIILNHIFKFALNSGYIEYNPVSDIDLSSILPKREKQHFKPAKNNYILKLYFKGIENTTKNPVTKLCLKFIFYTTLRQGTARVLKWEYIDLENEIIKIPAEVTKMKRDFDLPITPQIKSLLKELYEYTGYSTYLFTTNHKIPLSETSLKNLKTAIEKIYNISDKMDIHGIRHTFSTWAREHKDQHNIQEDLVIEFSLEHKDTNTIRDTYNKSTLFKDRKKLLIWWDNYLENL